MPADRHAITGRPRRLFADPNAEAERHEEHIVVVERTARLRGYLLGLAQSSAERDRLRARVAELEGHVLELRSRAHHAGGGPRKEDAPDFPGCRI